MNKFTLGITTAVIASMLLTGTILVSPMAMTNILAGLPTIFNTAIAQAGTGVVHEISISAETLPNGQDAYKMNSHDRIAPEEDPEPITGYELTATIPGPTIFVNPGDTVKVTLTNNIDGKSVGFNVPGITTSNAKASTGQSKTYTFTAGSAGTYLYQNKDDALLGLFGALVVNPTSGTVGKYVEEELGTITPVTLGGIEREYVLFMVGSTFWGQEINDGEQSPLWTNPMLGSELGEIVRFHILSVGPGHTFHLHAHRWVESMTNDNTIDTKLMKDGFDTHVFTVRAGADVGAGSWQYHCHVFAHMEAGMHGTFHVGMPTSQAGASPYNIHPTIASVMGIGAGTEDPGLVTFIISDEPGSWFKSPRDLSGPLVSKSLEVARVGDSVNFIMSDTDTVHTITSLLWPTGAEHMPMDEVQSYKGGGIVELTEAGLYVFTCKVHPYMFGAVIADNLDTGPVELGETITLVQYPGLEFPTASDLATRLLKTFFIATVPSNWQDYSSDEPWHISYPDLAPLGITFRVGTGLEDPAILDVPLKETLEDRYRQDIVLEALENPETSGVGEVWIDTQFEKTLGKDKPGTATAIDTTTWQVTKKVALDMNNPHNMWTDDSQSVIYQTEWFSNKLTTFDRETGALISQIEVGESPSHVMTRTDTGDIHVALNGEEGVAEILATTDPEDVERIIAMQGYGQDPTHPHAHWMSHDGQKMVTPNSFTGDSTLFGFDSDSIEAKPATGALPIATGMMPDSSKYYVANLLHSTISVIDMESGEKIKDINGLEDYNPLALGGDSEAIGDGFWPLDSEGPDTILQLAALPIQTPVSPNGEYMVTANTLSATVTVVDTETDEIVVTMFCDAGCHGVNFGAKEGGGYYAYVSSKFSNAMIVVDGDPNNNGDPSDARIVGRILLVAGPDTESDDTVLANAGTGGQGVLAIPNPYNGWVQNLQDEWAEQLTCEQRTPIDLDAIAECKADELDE